MRLRGDDGGGTWDMGKKTIAGFLKNTLLVLLCCWSTSTLADGFSVDSVQLRKQDRVYYVSARFDLGGGAKLRELLESGVSLNVLVDARVLRPRAFVWDDHVAEVQQRWLLQYHPLTRLYLIDDLNVGLRRPLISWAQVLALLERIKDLPLIDEALLDQGSSYQVDLRIRLDDASLPFGLRLSALTSDWKTQSPWKSAPLP